MLLITFQNDGTGTEEIGNYDWCVYINNKLLERGKLKNHKRINGWEGLIGDFVAKSLKLNKTVKEMKPSVKS